MEKQTGFSRVAAISAILSAPVALLSTVIAVYAVGFDFELLDDPAGLIALGAGTAALFRWSWILAAFGFYLLMIPAAIYLMSWLNSARPNLSRMATVFGLAYAFIGAISVIAMATVLSPMMQAYGGAPQAERALLTMVFEAVANLALMSLTTLAFIAGGVWWLGIGPALRKRYPVLGVVTVVLGAATLGSGLGYLFQVPPLARLEMFNYFLGPIWAAWLGIVVWRGAAQNEPGQQSLEDGRAGRPGIG